MRLVELANLRRAVPAALACALLATTASAQTTIFKFSLEGQMEGPAAVVLHAAAKGYFSAEGLDVAILPAATATDPLTRVASGEVAMAIADINALIAYRDQHPNAPIKAVFMLLNKPAYAVVGRKSRGVSDPKSLEGKRIAATRTVASTAQWPLFAKLNGVDPGKVTLDNVGGAIRVPMLAAGQVDAALGYSFTVFVNLKDRGVPADDIVLMPMADYGMVLYGSTVIVNPKFAADNPNAVKGFLRALVKGLKETVRHPADAVDSLVERNDATTKRVELERLRMALRDNILTPEVRHNGYGAVDPARLDAAIEQLVSVQSFKAMPKAADIFDASFLPPEAERKAN